MANGNTKKFSLDMLDIEGKVIVYKDYKLVEGTSFIKNGITFDDGFSITPYNYEMMELYLYEKHQDMFEPFENNNNNVKYIIAPQPFKQANKDTLDISIDEEKNTKSFNYTDYYDSFYTELNKLDVNKENEVIKFTKIWGIITGVTSRDFPSITEKNTLKIFCSSLNEMIAKVEEYQNIFKYFKSLITNDFSQIDPYIIHPYDQNINIKAHTISYLENELMHKNNFRLKLIFKDDDLLPVLFFEDLLDLAYYGLINALKGSKEMRKCEFCGHLFQIRHQRQKFCSPLPFRKRSSCEMAFHNKRK